MYNLRQETRSSLRSLSKQPYASYIANTQKMSALYSLRRVAYTGTKAIRVRRSSDDAELDIGFLGENLDEATLLAFCGSGSGYIKTWYDQGGNGNDGTQTNANFQPRIVNAGVIERDGVNNRPALYFDGSNDVLSIPTYPSTSQAAALYPTFASAMSGTILTNPTVSNNFVNTTGWSGTDGSVSVASNTLSLTGAITQYYSSTQSSTSLANAVGKRIYIRAKVRVTNANAPSITLYGYDGTNLLCETQNSAVQNQWYTLKGIVTITTASSNFIVKVLQNYGAGNQALNNGSVLEIQEVIAVDVTNLWNLEIASQPLMINTVRTVDSSATLTSFVLAKNADSSATTQYGMLSDIASGVSVTNGTIFNIEGLTTNMAFGANDSVPKGTQTIQSATWVNNTMQVYDDGATSGTTDTYSSTLTPRANINIGARSNNAGGTAWASFFKGYISEIIITTDINSRSKIEKSQGKYYGITV